jgi:hypothetical protein
MWWISLATNSLERMKGLEGSTTGNRKRQGLSPTPSMGPLSVATVYS